jgi:ATP-binding cassette, subfamily B, multidrug efflux pump
LFSVTQDPGLSTQDSFLRKEVTSIRQNSSWGAVNLIRPYFKRYALRVSAGFLALVAVDFLQLVIPRVIKTAVDALQFGSATSRSLLICGLYIILLALLIAVLRFFWRSLLLGFSRSLETDLRSRLFGHILTLDRAFFQRRTAGEIMALATNDLSSVQLASGMGLVAFVDAAFMGLAAIGFMAYINPHLTAIAIAPMPLLAIVTRYLSRRLHRHFKKVQEQFSCLTEFARSTLSGIRLIKAYNQEEPQSRLFEHMGKTYIRDNLRLSFVYGALFPISGVIANASLLLVLVFGGRMTIGGTITAGDFVAFINYLLLMTWPMMAIGWVADLFQRGITSLGRIQALFEEIPSLQDPVTAPPLPVSRGRIDISGLSFSYPQHTQPALQSLHLEIPQGRFLGVVGRTGSGKTTLCHLLTRLYPVPDGTIHFDGRDVNEMSLAQIRGAIAYVPQEVILFSETIAFNITMGKPDATQEEIEAAAKAAAIHDEIMAMMEGYQTRIGERGVKLSGGQRQRVAIARALLLNRPIIIIDDGLSAVDMETEHAIIRSIAGYLKGHTCIVVSHRIAPLADAEEIVVMERGRIIARGNHAELLQSSTFYATIYQQQSVEMVSG